MPLIRSSAHCGPHGGALAGVGAQNMSEQGVARKPPGAQPDRPCRCRLSLKSPITQLDQGQLPRCICRVHTQPTRTHLAANASLETVSFVRFPFSLQWPLPFGPLGPGASSPWSGRDPHSLQSGAMAGRRRRVDRALHVSRGPLPPGWVSGVPLEVCTASLYRPPLLKPSGKPLTRPRESDWEGGTSETSPRGSSPFHREPHKLQPLAFLRPCRAKVSIPGPAPTLADRMRNARPGEEACRPGTLTRQSGANHHATSYNLEKPLNPCGHV